MQLLNPAPSKSRQNHLRQLQLLIFLVLALIIGCTESPIEPEDNLDITEVSPSPGAVEVPLTAVISVQFNHQIDQVSVDSLTLKVAGLTGQISVTGGTLSFKPSEKFAPLTSYQVTMNLGIQSINGIQLKNSMIWSFQTGVVDSLPDFPDPPSFLNTAQYYREDEKN